MSFPHFRSPDLQDMTCRWWRCNHCCSNLQRRVNTLHREVHPWRTQVHKLQTRRNYNRRHWLRSLKLWKNVLVLLNNFIHFPLLNLKPFHYLHFYHTTNFFLPIQKEIWKCWWTLSLQTLTAVCRWHRSCLSGCFRVSTFDAVWLSGQTLVRSPWTGLTSSICLLLIARLANCHTKCNGWLYFLIYFT